MTTEVTLDVPNAILFVFDSAAKGIEIPEYVPDQVTSATKTAVSVSTRAYVDGNVTVRLADQLTSAEKHGCDVVFHHTIQSPSRRVAVFTSEFAKLLDIDVMGDMVRLTVSVDDAQSPSVVCIEAQ
jgi:hypothetical protein